MSAHPDQGLSKMYFTVHIKAMFFCLPRQVVHILVVYR